MIERDLANVTDLALLRPVRTGPGMDSGTPTSIATGLTAIYEPTQSLLKGADGREILLTGKFFIDPVDNDGVDIEVRVHDWLEFTDFKGDLQKRQVIRRVSPWYCGAELDHILLEVG